LGETAQSENIQCIRNGKNFGAKGTNYPRTVNNHKGTKDDFFQIVEATPEGMISMKSRGGICCASNQSGGPTYEEETFHRRGIFG